MPSKRVSFREQPNDLPVSEAAMRTGPSGSSNIGVASVKTTPAGGQQGYDPRQAHQSLPGHQQNKVQQQYSAPAMMPGQQQQQQHVNLYGSHGGTPQMSPHQQMMHHPQGHQWPMQPGAQGMMYNGHGQQAPGHYDQSGHWVVDENQFF